MEIFFKYEIKTDKGRVIRGKGAMHSWRNRRQLVGQDIIRKIACEKKIPAELIKVTSIRDEDRIELQ